MEQASRLFALRPSKSGSPRLAADAPGFAAASAGVSAPSLNAPISLDARCTRYHVMAAMLDQLKSRIASLLKRPRPLKPQTQRQLAAHLSEHSAGMSSFLLAAATVLQEHEVDILFAPLFTPTLDDRAELADLLYHWRPDQSELATLVAQLSGELDHTLVQLPDGGEAKLSLCEVMIDRFVRLLRLEHAPDPATAAAIREALPADLWPVAIALLCGRGMSRSHQHFFASFVAHMASRHPVTRPLLEAAVEFLAAQSSLEPPALVEAAEALQRATQGTAAFSAGGRQYWSPDVAQHHHYRGQGSIDPQQVARHQAQVQNVAMLLEDLRSLPPRHR